MAGQRVSCACPVGTELGGEEEEAVSSFLLHLLPGSSIRGDGMGQPSRAFPQKPAALGTAQGRCHVEAPCFCLANKITASVALWSPAASAPRWPLACTPSPGRFHRREA